MAGSPTIIMPFVKLERKLTREGWRMVRVRRSLEAFFSSDAGGGTERPSAVAWPREPLSAEML